MGDILTFIFYPQLLNLLKYWGLPLEDAMLKGGRRENHHKPEEAEYPAQLMRPTWSIIANGIYASHSG